MDIVLRWLLAYEYLAMFGILTLCGVGLPLPEEVTLLGSGLLVGWHEANFLAATLACASGILLGDFIIFGLGHSYGQKFLDSAPMHLLLSPSRQARVRHFFSKHGSKTLFLARFFPGVRIGVYAYAGSQGVSWGRFLWIDGLGVLLSAPISVWLGCKAAQAFADDRATAVRTALEMGRRVGHWVILGSIAAIVGLVVLQRLVRTLLDRR